MPSIHVACPRCALGLGTGPQCDSNSIMAVLDVKSSSGVETWRNSTYTYARMVQGCQLRTRGWCHSMISDMHGMSYSQTLRCWLSFSLLRSAIMCLSGHHSSIHCPTHSTPDTIDLACVEGRVPNQDQKSSFEPLFCLYQTIIILTSSIIVVFITSPVKYGILSPCTCTNKA